MGRKSTLGTRESDLRIDRNEQNGWWRQTRLSAETQQTLKENLLKETTE